MDRETRLHKIFNNYEPREEKIQLMKQWSFKKSEQKIYVHAVSIQTKITCISKSYKEATFDEYLPLIHLLLQLTNSPV